MFYIIIIIIIVKSFLCICLIKLALIENIDAIKAHVYLIIFRPSEEFVHALIFSCLKLQFGKIFIFLKSTFIICLVILVTRFVLTFFSFLLLSPDNLLLVELWINYNLTLLDSRSMVVNIHPRLSHFRVVSSEPFRLLLLLSF
jgi:hypothetical protein